MSTHPEHRHELMPRPARTPEALLNAIARLAPHRLGEMQRQKDEAFTIAVRTNRLGPIHGWMTVWAAEAEIERRPDLFSRRSSAELAIHTLDRTDPRWQQAMDEALAVVNEARTAVNE